MTGEEQFYGTSEDARLKRAGYFVCASNAGREWHFHDGDRRWTDGFRSEAAAVKAALVAAGIDPKEPPPREFAFDVKLAAAIRIKASDEAAARRALADVLDGADLSICHGGVDMPDTFEASLDGEPRLFEINGDAV